ncbi:hypothetical protein R1TS_23440 [Enterobacter cloacae]|nr:hypothetical protein R1TS_23440 [Enterobacter cloacae]
MSNLLHDNHYTVGELTKKLASKLTDAGLRLTTAESCTGGKLSVALCAEENTADFYDVGLVVFSDAAKARILGVRPETLARYTAVSEQTVTEMAASIRDIAQADISIAISGYAGPEGGRRRHGGGDGLFCVEHTWRDENPYRAFLRRLSGRGGKSGAFFAGRAGNNIVGRA